MFNIFKESENLILEPLEKKHLTSDYISWLNNKDIVQYNSHGIFPNTLEKTEEYINSVQFNKTSIVLAIIEKSSKKHIGNISISNIDFINSHAEISILIGEKVTWGRGYGYEAFELLIEHCFAKLNLHKVTAGTTSDNLAMQKVLNKLNMVQESTLKEHVKRDRKFFDVYTYAIINN